MDTPAHQTTQLSQGPCGRPRTPGGAPATRRACGPSVLAVWTIWLLAVLLPCCGRRGEAPAKRGEQRAVPVIVANAEKRDVAYDLRAVGTVEAFASVSITAQVTGELKKIHFREGDEVRKGDILFTIDSRPYQAAMAEAKSRLVRDQALAANARKELARYEELAKNGYSSQQELERVRTTLAAAEAGVLEAQHAMEAAGLNLQLTVIRSPIDGRTGSRLVDAGNVVTANDAKPLVVIRQDRPIFVRFAVPEQHLARIRSRSKQGLLEVEAAPRGERGAPQRGQVTLIENSVDPATGTIDLKARFDNEQEVLWPGQFADVSLRLDTDVGATTVPRAAVMDGRDGSFVFVVKPDKTVEARPVAVGRYAEDTAVVTTGLAPGDTVVIDGQLQLTAGSRIEVKPMLGAPVSSGPGVAAPASSVNVPKARP